MQRTLHEVKLLKTSVHADSRGTWERIFDVEESFLKSGIKQVSYSSNPNSGTLRGLHYQKEPYSETKLIKCVRGRIFDVVVDVRVSSSNYLDYQSFELSEDDGLALIVPPGFAHGFITLKDNSQLIYAMDEKFNESAYAGLRWSDPRIGIQWPTTPKLISMRDESHELIHD
jgi:dTDP-4-dehydrorhamnose 3,5-epimerase